jgi:TolB-like protein
MTPVESSAAEKPAARPSLSDKPSIAVLPFQNMSGDVEQEYFCDGLVEDIITTLSKLDGLGSSRAIRASSTKVARSTSGKRRDSSACVMFSRAASAGAGPGSGSRRN